MRKGNLSSLSKKLSIFSQIGQSEWSLIKVLHIKQGTGKPQVTGQHLAIVSTWECTDVKARENSCVEWAARKPTFQGGTQPAAETQWGMNTQTLLSPSPTASCGCHLWMNPVGHQREALRQCVHVCLQGAEQDDEGWRWI